MFAVLNLGGIKMRQQEIMIPNRQREDIPFSVIVSCNSLIASVRLMITSSGFDDDQVGHHLEYSPSHWSEILNGKKNLPWPKLQAAMDFCDSNIPLFWMCNARGFDRPHRLKNSLEVENEELRQQLAAQQREAEIMMKLVKEIRS